VIAKQLSDFLNLYSRETELFHADGTAAAVAAVAITEPSFQVGTLKRQSLFQVKPFPENLRPFSLLKSGSLHSETNVLNYVTDFRRSLQWRRKLTWKKC